MVFNHLIGVRFPVGPPKCKLNISNLKTLIIRTDKLGDFYHTLPYINTIKRKFGRENLDLLVSEEIYSHFVKKKYLYNKIYSFPKKNLLKKIFTVLKLRKQFYENILVADSKDRSLIFSIFLKCAKKIILYEEKKMNFFFKLFFLKKNNIVKKNNKILDINLYNNMLNKININNEILDFNFIEYKKLSNINLPNNLSENIKKYTLLHLDEKWFSKYYIKEFFEINPSVEQFKFFMKNFFDTHKHNLIITTGLIRLPFITLLCEKIFNPINSNFYEFNQNGYKALLITNTTFEDLEILTMNSKNLITCHTSLSFIASAFNINLIDIIDKNKDDEYNYLRHTSHIKNYKRLYRKEFDILSKEIILKIE